MNRGLRKKRNWVRLYSRTLLNTSTGCIEWQGSRDSSGYGRVRMEGRLQLTHRAAYILDKGFINKNIQVLHRCDNPKCINIHHLFLGTNDDNVADKVAKGRQACLKGEANGHVKLTEDNVREMRFLHSTGNYTAVQLSKKYRVSPTIISSILKFKNWAHISA